MIYLDHHAATPLVPAAVRAMEAAMRMPAASPSSTHAAGRAARAELERARDRVAGALGAAPADVVLTSGGTEALALAISGIAVGARRIVTSTLEHPAVTRAVERREHAGSQVVRVSLELLGRSIDASAGLVVVQHANHETGEVLPLPEIAGVCAAHGVPLVLDACQSFGKLALDVRAFGSGVAAVAVAASKIGGPAGAGALWVARGIAPEPLILGGAQERGRRAGAPALTAHAGFGAAALEIDTRLCTMPAIAARRDRLEAGLIALGAVSNAPTAAPRLPTVSNVSFRAWRGVALVAALDLEGLAASSGAACSSGLDAPSPVLRAAFPEEPWRAASALRLSLGPETTDDDVSLALEIVQRVVTRR